MLKLTTDKHEASRGLCATAELLVMRCCRMTVVSICQYEITRRESFHQ